VRLRLESEGSGLAASLLGGQAVGDSLSQIRGDLEANRLELERGSHRTVLEAYVRTRQARKRLRLLARLCRVGPPDQVGARCCAALKQQPSRV
jgi:hypothetical protein